MLINLIQIYDVYENLSPGRKIQQIKCQENVIPTLRKYEKKQNEAEKIKIIKKKRI